METSDASRFWRGNVMLFLTTEDTERLATGGEIFAA
jgi:hypothetical protein